MSRQVLEIENLAVRINGASRYAVENAALTIAEGETVCVVGESGSGKSVTALSVMGLLPRRRLVVDSGSIRLDGEDILEAAPSRLRALRASRMAMVFQEPMTALNPVERVGGQIDE
ncbi:MAG: ATP-binding cassette domain-containing protein, partial [Vulcanimicrobiaceae bacterium]